ncbi:hypothetical protein NL676_006244 [Syzygium grande]|nr:hypothetical protein NL676_006244 [Syzygium grande]
MRVSRRLSRTRAELVNYDWRRAESGHSVRGETEKREERAGRLTASSREGSIEEAGLLLSITSLSQGLLTVATTTTTMSRIRFPYHSLRGPLLSRFRILARFDSQWERARSGINGTRHDLRCVCLSIFLFCCALALIVGVVDSRSFRVLRIRRVRPLCRRSRAPRRDDVERLAAKAASILTGCMTDMFNYDSVRGQWKCPKLIVQDFGEKPFTVFSTRNPEEIPRGGTAAEFIAESTGDKDKAAALLKLVLLT